MWINKKEYNKYKKLQKSILKVIHYDKILHFLYDSFQIVIMSDLRYEEFLACQKNEKKIEQKLSFIKSDIEFLKFQVDNREEQIKELKLELEKYKHIYIDEYQKRIELIHLIEKGK